MLWQPGDEANHTRTPPVSHAFGKIDFDFVERQDIGGLEIDQQIPWLEQHGDVMGTTDAAIGAMQQLARRIGFEE